MPQLKYMALKAAIFMAFSLFSQTEPVVYRYPRGTISSEGYMINGKPGGLWKNYFEDGKLRSTGKMLNGKTDSTWLFFAESGHLKSKVNYSEGLKNGIRETYDPSGKLLTAELFKSDKKEGKSLQYFANGKLQFLIPFAGDKEQGMGFEWDQEGNIIRFFEFVNGSMTERKNVNRYDISGKKTGIWIETDEHQIIRKEMVYADDLIDGYVKWFDQKGRLSKVACYRMGKLLTDPPKAEQAKQFYKNGRIKKQGSFIGNKPTGLHLQFDSTGINTGAVFYEDGEAVSGGLLDPKGQKTGIWKEYYPGGKIKAEGHYEQDVKIGTWQFFYPSGTLEQKGAYRNGKPEGTWRWYYENGNLLRETAFIAGREDGISVELEENGDTLSFGEYVDDEREGPWFFKQGFISIRGSFKAGNPDGYWEQRYRGGKLCFEGNFEKGEGRGRHKAYYENGKIHWEGAYRDGKRDGIWVSYAEDGTPVISIEYLNGVEIRYDGVKIRPAFEPSEWENIIQHNPYIF